MSRVFRAPLPSRLLVSKVYLFEKKRKKKKYCERRLFSYFWSFHFSIVLHTLKKKGNKYQLDTTRIWNIRNPITYFSFHNFSIQMYLRTTIFNPTIIVINCELFSWKREKKKKKTLRRHYSDILFPFIAQLSRPTNPRADNNNVSNWLFRERRGLIRK